MIGDMTDTRTDPPYVAPEKAMLVAWLDWHRATLLVKCEALTDQQLRTRSVPPSTMSLLGLVRHLADVERGWHRRTLEGADASGLFYDETHPDGDFDLVDTADVEEAFAALDAEVAHAREVADQMALDDTGTRHGETVSLRWVLVHLIEEYARHNGHADLLRQRLDGAVGE